MSEHYLDFLSVVFWCIEHKRPVNEEVMRNEALHKELRGQTWENYSVEIVNEYPEILERIMPRYAKIKKTVKVEEEEEERPMME